MYTGESPKLDIIRSISKNIDYIMSNASKSRSFNPNYDALTINGNKVPIPGCKDMLYIKNEHGHDVPIPRNIVYTAAKMLYNGKFTSPDVDMDTIQSIRSRIQKTADYLSKELKRNPQTSPKPNPGKKPGEEKEGKKGEGKAKQKSEKTGNNSGPDSLKNHKPYSPQQMQQAIAVVKKIIKAFPLAKNITNEKDYGRMLPYLYSHLEEIAPLKSDIQHPKLVFVFQKGASGYMSEHQNQVILAMQDYLKSKRYSIELYEVLLRDISLFIAKNKKKPHAIITSGCAGGYGGDPSGFFDSIKKSKSKIFTTFDKNNNCGCNTFKRCEQHSIEINYEIIARG